MNTYKMPDGKEIGHINKYETDFLYKEIFLDRIYLKNNIILSPDSIIFDVGANIGMFALFIESQFPGADIFLFEPSPVLCEVISENVKGFKSKVNILQCGVSDKKGYETLTYYPGYSILSGFKAVEKENITLLETGIQNQIKTLNLNEKTDRKGILKFLSKGKLEKPITYKCKMTTLSDVIEEYKVKQIDLLKIDAEKCEIEIINGINKSDWHKIKQIVIEVHDFDGATYSFIESKLIEQGFHLTVEQEDNFKETGIYNLYGKKL